MDRSDDAKKRLAALHQPIPRPTKADVAQNRAELASRSEATTVQKLMGSGEERAGCSVRPLKSASPTGRSGGHHVRK